MNILILNWKDTKNPEAGGAEVIAFFLAEQLAKKKNSVTFFCSNFPGGSEREIVEDVTVIRKGNKFSVFWHAFLYYKSLQKKPDLIIEMVNTIAWLTPLYIRGRKRIAYLNQLAQSVWFYEFKWPISWIGYIVERLQYLIYTSTQFLCYSQSTKKDLVSYGIPQKNIHIFPLGVDHDRYKKMGLKSKDPLFIFVARLVKMKRADVCIEAIGEVVKKNKNAKLAIIGNGSDEERLRELILQHGLGKNISIINKNNFYVKKQTGDIKVEYMQKAWAIILPSVKEGWGMVITEAASCGTPAIVSDTSGLRDSVVSDKTGIIVSSHPDSKELSRAMQRIIDEKQFREEISKGAYEWSKKFTWEESFHIFNRMLTDYAKAE